MDILQRFSVVHLYYECTDKAFIALTSGKKCYLAALGDSVVFEGNTLVSLPRLLCGRCFWGMGKQPLFFPTYPPPYNSLVAIMQL